MIKAQWCPKCGSHQAVSGTCLVCGNQVQDPPTTGSSDAPEPSEMFKEQRCACRFHEISDKKCELRDLRAEVEVLNCKIATRDSIIASIASQNLETKKLMEMKNKVIAELEAKVSKMSKVMEVAELLAEVYKPIVDGRTS